MKLEQFLYVRIAGIFCLILTQPAFAEKNQSDTGISINTKDTFAPVETRLKKIKNQPEESEKSISNIPQLSEIQLPKTSVKDLLAQEWNVESVSQILSVRCAYLNGLLTILVVLPKVDAPENITLAFHRIAVYGRRNDVRYNASSTIC